VAHAWQNSDFGKRIEITVPSPDGNLTAHPFPILLDGLSIVDTDIVEGEWCLYDHNDNLLAWEEEAYAEGGGTCTGVIWTAMDQYAAPSGEQNHVFFYYDKVSGSTPANTSTDVWDASYEAVWHLAENGGTYYDSTSNNHDDTRAGADPTQTTGIIGNGQSFDGSKFINFVSLGLGTSDLTLTVWSKSSDTSSDGRVFCDGGDMRYEMRFLDAANTVYFAIDDDSTKTEESHANNIEDGAWHYLQARRDYGSTLSLTVDGDAWDSMGDGTGDITTTDYAQIGASAAQYGLYWKGDLDEVRVSSAWRSDAWCKHDRTVIVTGLVYGSIESKPAAGGIARRKVFGSLADGTPLISGGLLG
jgi:hypothetical protein